MLSELIRLRSDILADPKLLGICMPNEFSVASLLAGARSRGYDVVASDIIAYCNELRETQPSKVKTIFRPANENRNIEDLDLHEYDMVVGGYDEGTPPQVAVATYVDAYVYVYVGVYTAIAAMTVAVVFATSAIFVMSPYPSFDDGVEMDQYQG